MANLQDVEMLFLNPPREPDSVRIIPHNIIVGTDKNMILFEMLLDIMHRGMLLLFGDGNGKVDISKLSEDDIFLMKRYFNSFGFDLEIQLKPEMYIQKSFIARATSLDKMVFYLRQPNGAISVNFFHL